jgi:DNA-binding beta-propeller fold protein YncE
MIRVASFILGALALFALPAIPARSEILAMLNYESKPEQPVRREGIAVIDVDPGSESFGKILMDIPLPPDLIAHHIFYNKDESKAYVTALGKSLLHVIDMKRFPYRLKAVEVPDCKVGEDIAFSDDNRTWYLTCMGSDNVIVGDAATDKPLKTITAPWPNQPFIRYPHGIGIHGGIDRLLVPSTVRASDLKDPGETVTVIEASSGKVLSTHKVSNKPSPSGEAPVEAVFLPGSTPPVAYITNMFGGTLWTATWNPEKRDFDFRQSFDFGPRQAGVPLEIYFNKQRDRLYVTTAKPGYLNVFDISQDATQPKLLKMIPAAAGAHHVAFSQDEHYAFVQNSLLNLPDMSDGSITVIDLAKDAPVATINTLKDQGFNPNSIVLLPTGHPQIEH